MDEVPSVVSAYVAAYNARDVAAMLTCLAADIHFVDRSHGVDAVETRGIDDFRRLAEFGATAFSSRSQTITDCIAGDTHATLKIVFRGTVAVDLANGWTAGDEIRLDGISLFTLAGGRIGEIIDIS